MSLISRHGARAFALATAFALALPAAALAAEAGTSHIVVEHPWARASAGMAANGAAYMTITEEGSGADRLVAASSPVCAMAQLHVHLMHNGVMEMRPVSAINVDAGSPTVLQPGGLHIMLMQLKKPLKQGETFPMTLTFQKAGAITVQVSVESAGAMDMPGMKMGH